MLVSGSDHAIFAELQRDGRAPFTAVAERLGLSEAQVRRRVRWLTDADVFAVTAVADPAVLGLRCMAWIGIEVRPPRARHAGAPGGVGAEVWGVDREDPPPATRRARCRCSGPNPGSRLRGTQLRALQPD